ncbi:MAG TPA: helix-turn-helix domain-containing protein [Chloroflexota bacterium]
MLERIIRRDTSPQQRVQRAKIVVAAAAGANNGQVGRQIGVKADTARLWRGRWAAVGEALLAAEAEGDDRALEAVILGVLADEPRPGAPATFTPEQLCRIMALACTPPAEAGRPIDAWTPRELADEAARRGIVDRISPSTVGRFLKGGRPQAAPQPLLAHAGAR